MFMIDERIIFMPCNLAVTITKAVVAPEHLLKLLTPQVVEALVDGFVRQHPTFVQYASVRVMTAPRGVVTIWLGYNKQMTIVDGQVSARFPRGEEANGEMCAQLISTLLAKGADRLFAQQVKKSLQQLGTVQEQQTKVKDGDQVIPVTMFKLEI